MTLTFNKDDSNLLRCDLLLYKQTHAYNKLPTLPFINLLKLEVISSDFIINI